MSRDPPLQLQEAGSERAGGKLVLRRFLPRHRDVTGIQAHVVGGRGLDAPGGEPGADDKEGGRRNLAHHQEGPEVKSPAPSDAHSLIVLEGR